jgi:hypothetical protein
MTLSRAHRKRSLIVRQSPWPRRTQLATTMMPTSALCGAARLSLFRGQMHLVTHNQLSIRLRSSGHNNPERQGIGADTSCDSGPGKRPTSKPASGPAARLRASSSLPATTGGGRASPPISARNGRSASSHCVRSGTDRTVCSSHWTSSSGLFATDSATTVRSRSSSQETRASGASRRFCRRTGLLGRSNTANVLPQTPAQTTAQSQDGHSPLYERNTRIRLVAFPGSRSA